MQKLEITNKEVFYLKVLLMKELEELDKHDKVNVFRGVKLSIYMKLYEQLDKIQIDL